jgi:hypothetical protein
MNDIFHISEWLTVGLYTTEPIAITFKSESIYVDLLVGQFSHNDVNSNVPTFQKPESNISNRRWLSNPTMFLIIYKELPRSSAQMLPNSNFCFANK